MHELQSLQIWVYPHREEGLQMIVVARPVDDSEEEEKEEEEVVVGEVRERSEQPSLLLSLRRW